MKISVIKSWHCDWVCGNIDILGLDYNLGTGEPGRWVGIKFIFIYICVEW